MAIVTTGQITIVDNNDARPISAFVQASPGPQQVYGKDESVVSYTPDWTTANANIGLILTPKVYLGGVGSATEISGQMTNRKFSTDLSTAITGTAAAISGNASLAALFVNTGTFTVVHSGVLSSLTLKANMLDTVPQAVIYFEGDYTDPVTGLVSHIVAPITLGIVKTGTNAVFVIPRGQSTIENATGATKNVAVMAADLIRAAGVDTSGVTYRFFEANGSTQIITGAPFSTKYGLKTTAYGSIPTGSNAEIGVNLPASGAWSTFNTLVIHETAVTDIGNYRVEAKDADDTIYQAYFTINDISDPYQLNVLSSSGDKLQNGVGSSTLTPEVYYGAAKVSSLTGWTFTWTMWNKDGKRAAFIDTTKTAQAGGRNITANTIGDSAVLTYDGAAITFAAGDIIKCVTPTGSDRYFEVASGTGNTVTIRTPVTNTFLNFTDFPAPAVANDFVSGEFYACVGSFGQRTTAAAATITITGDEVNAKARFTVDANRP